MKRPYLLVLLAAGALGIGVYTGRDWVIPETSTGWTATPAEARSDAVAPTAAHSTRQLPRSGPVAVSKAPTAFSHLPQSRDRLPLEGDPFVAESPAEQRWLDRNGYPNAEQWKSYSAASDGTLQQAAAAGDKLAAIMLDARALQKGDKDAPNRLFSAASREGSLFALSLLTAYMAGSANGDPVFAYALSRVLEMKGDTRAALGREAMFQRPLTPEERLRAEADALRLFETMKRNSKRQPLVDPRPFP